MALRDELKIPSFKGAEFLWISIDTESGRKTVTHEYPGSSFRTVEDLNSLPRKFRVNAEIAEPNASEKARKLEAALDSKGAGILVHPRLGGLNVTGKPYTVNERISRIGIISFSMPFERSDVGLLAVPQQQKNSNKEINDLKDIVVATLEANVAANFLVSTSFPNNFDDAQEKVNDIANASKEFVGRFTKVADIQNEFNAQINLFIQSALALINVPADLAEEITSIQTTATNSPLDAVSRLQLSQLFFDFGDNDTVIVENTTQRIERKRNRDVLNLQIQGQYLAQAYNNSAQIEFNNIEELDSTVAIIEDQYQKFVAKDNLDDDSAEALADIRAISQQFFEEQRLNVSRITTVNTPTIPMAVLAYQYYGSTDNTDALITLNQTRNVSQVMGDTRILTA